MAIDGSFSLESQLERFLARCPKLACIPQFDSLLKKRNDDRRKGTGNFEDAGDASVIEFFARNGWGLNLHELACLAFCRALDLAPFLLGSTLSYFRFAPPPFERMLIKGSVSELPAKAGKHLLNSVQTAYRFLLMEPDVFSRLWDWSCFLDLVQKLANLDMVDDDKFVKNISDIRWCGLQILFVILKMNDTAIANFGIGAEEALGCLLRWEELCEDVAQEKAGWYFESSKQQKPDSINPDIDFDQENCLRFFGLNNLAVSSSQFPEAQPSTRIRRLVTWNGDSCGNPLVLTLSLKKSYEMVLLAVSQKWPVLLYGPAGVGKTALISKLARDSGNQVLSIHMDDQIDGKTLIGSYVCMERPGEFRWQPGSLTQAAMNGFWVVFEGIDKAPSDVQSILLPLLEGASSFLTSHGEAIRVAESFRLFSTISSSNVDISCKREGGNSLGVLWRRVMIGHPSNEDLQSIVKAWYPELEPVAGKLIGARVNYVPLYQLGGFQSGNHPSFILNVRDLLKWCKRIAALGFHFLGDGLSADACKCIFLEAVDIFAAFSASAENRLTIMRELAKMWAVSDSVAEAFYPPNKPVIQDLGTDLTIGRVTLHRHQRVLRHQKKLFVEIRSSLHLLERIACSVKCNEPVLLVGETGTGKTTLVQTLAMRLGQKLTVLNLSQQSDVADLLGGFKPMDAQFVCIPLYKDFENLFSKTFSVKDNGEFLARLQHHLSDKNWKMLMTGFKKAWEDFSVKLDTSRGQIGASSGMLFQFVEGAFVTALRNGDWILLDEVNLAPPETLQRRLQDGANQKPQYSLRSLYRAIEYTNKAKRKFGFQKAIYDGFSMFFLTLLDVPSAKLMNQMILSKVLGGKIPPQNYILTKSVREHLRNLARAVLIKRYPVLLQGPTSSGKTSLVQYLAAITGHEFVRINNHEHTDLQEYLGSYVTDASGKLVFHEALNRLLDDNRELFVPELRETIPAHPDFMLFATQNPPTLYGGRKMLSRAFRNRFVEIHVDEIPEDELSTILDKRCKIPESYAKKMVEVMKETFGNSYEDLARDGYYLLAERLRDEGEKKVVQAVLEKHLRVKLVKDNLYHQVWFFSPPPFPSSRIFMIAIRDGSVANPLRYMLTGVRYLLLYPNCWRRNLLRKENLSLLTIPVFLGKISYNVFSSGKHAWASESLGDIIWTKSMRRLYFLVERCYRLREPILLVGETGGGKTTICQLLSAVLGLKLHILNCHQYTETSDFLGGFYPIRERSRLISEFKFLIEQLMMLKAFVDFPGDISISSDIGHASQTLDQLDTIFMWQDGPLVQAMKDGDLFLVDEISLADDSVLERLNSVLEPERKLALAEKGGSSLEIITAHPNFFLLATMNPGGDYGKKELSPALRNRFTEIWVPCVSDLDELRSIALQRFSNPKILWIVDPMLNFWEWFNQLQTGRALTVRDLLSWVAFINVTEKSLQPDYAFLHGAFLVLLDGLSLGTSLPCDSIMEIFCGLVVSLMDELFSFNYAFSLLVTLEGLKTLMDHLGTLVQAFLKHAVEGLAVEAGFSLVVGRLETNQVEGVKGNFLIQYVSKLLKHQILSKHFYNNLACGGFSMYYVLCSVSNEAWLGVIGVSLAVTCFYVFIYFRTGISKEDAGRLRENCLSFLVEQLKVSSDGKTDFCCALLLEKMSLILVTTYKSRDLLMVFEKPVSIEPPHSPPPTPHTPKRPTPLDNHFGIHPFYIEKALNTCMLFAIENLTSTYIDKLQSLPYDLFTSCWKKSLSGLKLNSFEITSLAHLKLASCPKVAFCYLWGDQSCEIKGFEFLAPTTCKNAFRVLRAMQLAKPVLLEGSPGVGKTSLIVALGKFSGHPVVRINLSEQTDIMDLLGSDLPVESSEGIKFAWSDGILLQALKQGSWVLLDELNLAPQSVLEGLNAILDHRAEVFIPELGVTFKCPSSFRVFACQNPSSQGGGRKGLPRSFLNRFTKVYVDELVEDDYLFICSSLYPSIQRPILSKLILFNKRLHEDIMLNHKFAQDGSPWEFNLRDVIRSCEIIEGAPEKLKPDCFLNIVYVQRMRTAADRREVLRLYEQVFQVKPQLKILPGIRQSLEAVAHCVQRQWLCILVGPSSSGKTSLIRLLAHSTGNVLNELSLSSATDISELLGCFEQYNAFRNFRSVVDMITGWLAVFSLCLLVEIIEHLRLQEDQQKRTVAAKFEWVTGLLIKALENGEWIVLDNANLCNPTVLDRINSLVEPCGSITVNECGIVDGKPLVVHPHPNFRMFLTVKPSHGDVSRAMRNRGVEIFMMQPYWPLDQESDYYFEELELKDVKRFLVLSDIPGEKLVEAMAKAHIYARDEVEFSEFDSSLGCSLCLPGGWPRPLRIRDLVYHSREVGVKQNCMYLEFLGTQYASCELGVAWDRCLVGKALTASVYPRMDLMNVKILNHILFPKASNEMLVNYDRQTKFNAALIDKMLLFAANWTIEQATESDLKLYLLWFSWFNSRLLPFCQFFNSFLTQLKEELKHSIWNCIIGCYRELISHHQVDLDSQPIPMLSLELVDLIGSDDMSKISSRRLCNAINSIGLLRRSLQQWNAESGYNFTDESRSYIPVLRSLQVLEDEVLNALVESPSFDLLIQLLTNLLEDHILFWNSVTSSKFDYLLISWHSLMKDAMKLRDFFPKSVKHLLMEVRDLDRVSLWHLHSQKSLLWVYGGHPNMPSSADLYWKQHKLLCFCEFVWPTKTKSWEQVDDRVIDAVVSSSPDLRFLAMQGVCMSSYITGRCDKDDATVVQQLEEMHQMLLERFEHEKHKLEAKCVASRTIALSSASDLLEYAMNFSLNFSSRPPTIFLPHQKFLWTLDAWESVNAVSAKIVSFVLEMWFRWHSSLWINHPASVKNFSKIDAYDIPLPAMLVQPVKTATIFQILESRFAIKDYHLHCLKLRVASHNLWKSSTPRTDLHGFLLSAARALFQQIIYTHQKTFDADNYATIKFIFSSFQKTNASQENIKVLSSLIASSNHHRLTASIPSFIEPVLRELYLQCSSTDFLYNLGCAWSRIGGLRFCLLLSSSDLDPAMKYSIKYSLLEEKISSLELETKVRQECDHLVGWFSTREADKQRAKALENLKVERERLQKKMVFRSDPGKFKDLKHEFGEFLKRVTYLVDDLMRNIEVMDLQVMIGEVCNWQETATCFVNRLSDEYAAYTDIIQPVQVAVYEMKLGLSLVLSSSLQKGFQNRVMQDNMDGILATIYSFIRFPRDNAGESIAVEVKFEFPSYGVGSPSNVWSLDMNVLEKLVTITRGLNADRTVSVLQLKAAVRQNILVRVAHFVANAHLFDNASFMLSNKIFDEIACFWMNMKVQVKGKEDYDAQQYKFKPRAFKMENIIEIDISTLGNSFANESFSEWQELLSEDEFTEKKDANEELEEEWSLMQESILSNMVHIHNRLFGSVNLVLNSGVIQVSDADRLRSFIDSYALGVGMIKGLEGLLSSSLDVKLVPEHLLRLCLEHEPKFVSYHKVAHTYNFYKDSNASMMAKMVKLLTALQKRLLSLLNEWEDHPGLQKILGVIEMLLAIPSSTPLAKVVTFASCSFFFPACLKTLFIKFYGTDSSSVGVCPHLYVSLFLFMSFRGYEGQTYFPFNAILYSLDLNLSKSARRICGFLYTRFFNIGSLMISLHIINQQSRVWRSSFKHLALVNSENVLNFFLLSMVRLALVYLWEFIRGVGADTFVVAASSKLGSVGRFEKWESDLILESRGGRVGENVTFFTSLGGCSGGLDRRRKGKILYNVFGYYVQFLPIALEHVQANRKNIETELKELLKLCRWEHSESYLSMENSKKTQQKLRKLIQKYTVSDILYFLFSSFDLLQQPVMLILNLEATQRGIKSKSIQELKVLGDFPDKHGEELNAATDLTEFSDKNRSVWYPDWRKKVAFALKTLQLGKTPEFNIPFLSSPSPCLVYLEHWREVRSTLEHVCRTVTECADLWKDVSKNLGKRRALSELLKLLESCGLSRHKSIFFEVLKNECYFLCWLLQPSYDVQHLLPMQGRLPYQNVDLAASSQLQSLIHEVSDVEWSAANRYYFKSIASVQLLRQICLNFHKDFTLEQVNRSVSFLDHLIIIQQEQRNAVYHFSEHVKDLRKSVASLENLYSSSTTCDNGTDSKCSVAPNQHATLKYMWQQKQLFDGLCSMLHEESLLLRTVESTHLSTCQHVKGSANRVLVFIEKFVPLFQKSKESLDDYLLGRNRVLTTVATSFYPPVITKQMEQLVFQNFQVIREFEECLCAFQRQEVDRRSVQEVLLNRFEDIMKKGKAMAEQFNNALEGRSELSPCDENHSELEAGFSGAFERTLKHIMDAFQKLGPLNNTCALSEWSSDNITSWKVLFESYVMNLQLDSICDELHKTIFYAGKLLNHSGNKIPSLCFQVETYFKHLYQLLDLVSGFSDGLLHDFLDVHKKVSMMTHVLANVFASLYSEGFGTPTEDQIDDNSHDTSKDAKGTGMGEGVGLKDVSDQITDEDQLLGASEKPSEEQDVSDEVPSKNDKGIEMEQDFAADTFSVSEESGDDDNEDSGDEQLDSAMGETGADSEIVDEKLWNKDADENANNTKEKYESGPSVTDKDASSRELRAKEDDAAAAADEPGQLNQDESNEQNDEIGSQDDLGNTENMDDMNMDKEDAFADPSGLKLDETNPMKEDLDMDEQEGADPMEEAHPEEHDEFTENGDGKEEDSNPADENLEEAESGQVDGNSERDDLGKGNSDFISDHVPNAESATQPKDDMQAADSRNMAPETKWSNSSDIHNNLAPISGLPSNDTSEMEMMVADSSMDGKLTNDQPKTQLPQQDSSSIQKTQANPYRNVGDALEEWKERARVSSDLQEDNTEAPENVEDENADEYGYVSEFEKGTAQALGPATFDQIDKNITQNEPDVDGVMAQKEHLTKENEKQNSETDPIKSSALNLKKRIEEQMQISDSEVSPKEISPEVQSQGDGDPGSVSESLVSIKRSYLNEDIYQLSKLSVSDELRKAKNLEEASSDMKDNAAALWRRYELLTTRLSQELAEQLRLVMEPTLASKLQGDYKTGKRINMKKVIPYIASHYRKDKIWLRRTRPNKRDYQVVIAVDDSRSMSESCCGDVAIEALVTVCRAMSQLEVGNLAVASYGKEGNIRLLHDFDQSFTGEAGIKMISNLTFKQENTIKDEPVVDLLKYLNNMLDTAVANARLPSGQNPLQQLVLIIADGRFIEKENLKRCVRDVLSRKRMVAFLLLDSPQESIMDLQEVSFQGGNMKISKYLDSFPFPYYIILKNIEALPRTLADLLRQWFELMQHSRD
ncbi:unnamed protein product, partial [Vitis vinifera]